MKKVLFLTNIPSPYRVLFLDELGKTCEVTALFSDENAAHSERDAKWFIEGKNQFRAVQLQKRRRLPGGLDVCTDVIDWLKKPFDAVIIHGYAFPTFMLAEAWLRLHKRPFYIEADGAILAPESAAKTLLKRILIGAADGWFSPGKMTDEFLMHYGAKQERIYHYPFSSLEEADLLPAPSSGEEKQALRKKLGMTEKNIVLAIGQFIPRKGFDVLMQGASKLMDDTGIYFVGGEPTEEYRELAKKSGNTNVHFVGFCKKQELGDYYRAADVFALPTREDIWGLVINEAMGYGLPVVTTYRCVAGVELVEDGVNGYLVPVEDADTLVEKINAILSGDREAMGRASLRKIQNYTIQGMARAHRDVL